MRHTARGDGLLLHFAASWGTAVRFPPAARAGAPDNKWAYGDIVPLSMSSLEAATRPDTTSLYFLPMQPSRAVLESRKLNLRQ